MISANITLCNLVPLRIFIIIAPSEFYVACEKKHIIEINYANHIKNEEKIKYLHLQQYNNDSTRNEREVSRERKNFKKFQKIQKIPADEKKG